MSDRRARTADLRLAVQVPGAMPVRKVRRAYEQVADQLRELIVSGTLARGQRLPNETVLAHEFGVSRATIREALRVLAAQNLVRTAKGTGGGTYVTLPTVDHVSEFLMSSISLLTESHDVSLEEFLEMRELLEVAAARLAAQRRREAALEGLRQAIPEDPGKLDKAQQFVYNKDFHSWIVQESGNVLLQIAAQPVFSVLQTNLQRSLLTQRFFREVNQHHRQIAAAVEAGDARAAERTMREHIQFLRSAYERVWRHRQSIHRDTQRRTEVEA